jgi:hypothetical protein
VAVVRRAMDMASPLSRARLRRGRLVFWHLGRWHLAHAALRWRQAHYCLPGCCQASRCRGARRAWRWGSCPSCGRPSLLCTPRAALSQRRPRQLLHRAEGCCCPASRTPPWSWPSPQLTATPPWQRPLRCCGPCPRASRRSFFVTRAPAGGMQPPAAPVPRAVRQRRLWRRFQLRQQQPGSPHLAARPDSARRLRGHGSGAAARPAGQRSGSRRGVQAAGGGGGGAAAAAGSGPVPGQPAAGQHQVAGCGEGGSGFQRRHRRQVPHS